MQFRAMPMAKSPMSYSRKNNAGMTLIEVLIALAIIAIAMTAIIKATSENIRGTHYLQNKTIALWVGQEVLNEARLGLLKLPESPDAHEGQSAMLGEHWYWKASQMQTPNKRIKKLSVKVYNKQTHDEDESPVIGMETYVYKE